MREYLTVERDANQIRFLRSTFSGTFLLVEGHSDKLVYERLVNSSACQVVIVSGKPSSKLRVIAVLEILEESDFPGILAIIDADFDHLEPLLDCSPNLLHTDSHDLETMLINSPAFDKVVAEFGSEDKINNFAQDVRTVLAAAGMSVGYLRWVSQCEKLNLTFNGIKFSKFINETTLQIDELKLITEVRNKSPSCSWQKEELKTWVIKQKSSSHDPWQVCCGHDLVEILSLSLRKVIGSNKAAEVEPNILERSLRLAYEEAYFCKTLLYSKICTWEANNQPFKVLAL
ncbi:MAG: DUF4435 domain-containing protein [Symploca sp. SIO1B1]|nr:DUF4435 domain-containing protein [Symploca sp. SIO1C2]NER47798.1 DUF4435 domain-containing protein [Symploca sp. SIO1A3]NER97968.1 DUF4435 domain-containing protein [Symploca sp. SIO1B1]